MSKLLLEKLRKGCIECGTGWLRGVDQLKTDMLLDEAADEIERLHAELEALKKIESDRWTGWAKSFRNHAILEDKSSVAEYYQELANDWNLPRGKSSETSKASDEASEPRSE